MTTSNIIIVLNRGKVKTISTLKAKINVIAFRTFNIIVTVYLINILYDIRKIGKSSKNIW